MAGSTILIVDDDRTIVRLCHRLLERASYQVISSMDPADALQILERQKVDLLLTDIRMPVMSGFELIGQAKQIQPELPVLVMTGYGSIENAIQALHRGVDGLLLKPFENTAELVQAVQWVLNESAQKREAARLQALRPLFDVTERLLAETSLHTLENLILNAVSGIFQASFAGIYRLNPESSALETVRTVEIGQPETKQGQVIDLIEQVVEEGVPVLINTDGINTPPGVRAQIQAIGWDSLLVAPVRRNNTLFVFCAARDTGVAPLAEADMEMFVILARQAGVALENARLYSDLRDYVRRVEESQRALIQAEKMAAVGRLMASLAHEINNPLQAVRNCMHLAARKGLDSEQRLHYLEMTDGELERLVKTVRGMLDFYRPGGAERERTRLQDMIDHVLALLGPQLRDQGIQVHSHMTGEIPLLYVVADQIQQVIFNLILNAMDALDEVPGTPDAASKEIWIDVYQTDGQVHILIEDSGPGIPANLEERVFEPFVSSKPQGTGLGLAVSYGIMERHQGCLTIIPPRHHEGACFEMMLPVEIEGEDGKNINR